MKRVSASKLILDSESHSDLIDQYESIIKRLEDKFGYSEKIQYKDLVNFSTNKEVPIHKWYDYKQGYASELIRDIIIKENPSMDYYVFDPFCGVGTTNLAAKDLGYDSIGLDINPMACLAAKTKCRKYTTNDIDAIKDSVKKFNTKQKWHFNEKPKVVDSSFTKDKLEELQIIKAYIDTIKQDYINDFLLLAYLSIVEDASIRVKDGNGIKLKKNKKQVADLYSYFRNKCYSMIDDLEKHQTINETEHLFFNGSLIQDSVFDKVKDKKAGISIFSPPYANCFDYCEVYKLEFWLGGFVSNYGDFAKYRNIALRSHVNSSFDHSIENSIEDVDTIANLISTYNIWNKNIPDMIRGYFDDMYKILSLQTNFLVKGAKCYIVVANSGYKGIMVPTDLLLAKIAEKIGYKVNNIFYARKIRASGQQNNDLHQNYDNLMRESIIELQLL